MTQSFGSKWTIIKLDVVGKYLSAYVTAMKNKNFRLCYVDAFSGSGVIETKVGMTRGSALQALDYNFHRYYFFEEKRKYLDELEENLRQHPQYEAKKDRIICENEDCNNLLATIHEPSWYRDGWRGIVFLDPYAMQLDWKSLESIKQTQAFDIWYLFPYSSVMRCLSKKYPPDPAVSEKVSKVLGTREWKEDLYKKLPPDSQRRLFSEPEYASEEQTEERVNAMAVEEYIVGRMERLFGMGFLKKSLNLRNSKNSTQFLLFFACSNESESAIRLSHRIAGHLIDNSRDGSIAYRK